MKNGLLLVFSVDGCKKSVTVLAKYFSLPERSYWILSQNGMGNWLWSYHSWDIHCVKSIQIRSFFLSVFSRILTEYGETSYLFVFSPNGGKYGPVKSSVFGQFFKPLLWVEVLKKIAVSPNNFLNPVFSMVDILLMAAQNPIIRSIFWKS